MISNTEWGESDREQLPLTRDPKTLASCRDAETKDWFEDAKARTEERTGQDLTNEEFTLILLDIFEYHEQTRTVGGAP
jgi:hypothetical protein